MTTAVKQPADGSTEVARVRVVTAASLFDGHDAAINIMRRILQAQGAEVIHLGHDRSVDEIVRAAICEGAHAVAVSSYQGGHMEFIKYLVDELAAQGAGWVRVFGGGGGTITESEIAELHQYGVARIFSPDDGRSLGLQGMIRSKLDACGDDEVLAARMGEPEELAASVAELDAADSAGIARLMTALEEESGGPTALASNLRARLDERAEAQPRPAIVGFTGTGGAGKSSVVDELVRRFREDFPELRIGMLLIDPTRRRTGGALLGDRIRMNAIQHPGIFVRSMATRQANLALSASVHDGVRVLRAAGFDLILVETAGIGQSDSEIIDLVDLSLYVMTPEFGAPSQLEKIDMLDLADVVILNKCDKQGARDALRDIKKQWRRNREEFELPEENVPVFPTLARNWSDPGTDRLYAALRDRLPRLNGQGLAGEARGVGEEADALTARQDGVPPARIRYLAEIAECVRAYKERTSDWAREASEIDGLARAIAALGGEKPPMGGPCVSGAPGGSASDEAIEHLAEQYDERLSRLPAELRDQLLAWPATRERYAADTQSYSVRDKQIEISNHVSSLSGTALPHLARGPGGSD